MKKMLRGQISKLLSLNEGRTSCSVTATLWDEEELSQLEGADRSISVCVCVCVCVAKL